MITLALTLLAQAGTISYDAPMGTVRQVLDQVAKDAGMKIEHTGIGHLPILVQVSKVEPKALLERIAEVTDADLTPISGGYRLSRGPNRIQSARQTEMVDLAARLQPALDEKKKAISEYTDWSERAIEERAERMGNKIREAMTGNENNPEHFVDITFGDTVDLPPSIMLAKLITLPASTWVGDPGNVVRLSDRPNKYQKALTADLSSAYAAYANAHNHMVMATQAKVQIPNLSFGLDNRQLQAGDVNRTVVLANWVYPGSVGLTVLLVDTKGSVVGNVSMSLPLAEAKPNEHPPFEGEPDEVSLPAETIALNRAMIYEPARRSNGTMSMMNDGLTIRLGDSMHAPKQTEAVLNRLESNQDPFEDVVGMALRGRAKRKDENLVAVFPTTLFGFACRLGIREKFKLSELGKIFNQADITLVEDGGWLRVRPRLAVNIERDLANREALRALCQQLRKQGYGRIDQLSGYVNTRYGRIDRGHMDFYWLKAANIVEANRLADSEGALRLYAGLPAEIKKQTSFIGPAEGPLAKVVNDRLTTFIGTTVIIGQGTSINISSEKQSNDLGRYDLSEGLARGPAMIFFTQTESAPLYVQRRNEGSGKFLSVEQLGVYRALSKISRYAEYNDDLMPYDAYRPATGRSVEMRIELLEAPRTTRRVTTDRLEDNIASTNQGPWTWQTMPQDVKQRILDAETKLGPEFGGG